VVLDDLAKSVSYSIRVCVAQLAQLVKKYGNTIPSGYEGAHEDALLEAGLMHVRALDDFFKGGPGRTTDMRAGDWVKWQPKLWLDPRVRAQIDWQVVHLTGLSGMRFPPFKPADIGAALCEEVERFFHAVEDQCPDRLPAFEHNVREVASSNARLFEQLASTGGAAT
jgi:hypothetical protein